MKKIAKTVGTLGLVGCAVMSSQFAVADDSLWYIGGNIGQSQSRIDDGKIVARLRGSMLTTTSISNDDTGFAYKLFGGYRLNRNFALEAGYFNLGQFGYTATTLPSGTLNGKIKLDGLNLDAVGMLPLNEKFSAFGRIGVIYGQAKDNFTGTGFVPPPTNPSPSKNFKQYKAGLGIQYDFNKSLGMRAEAERYRINDAVGSDADINVYSLGLVYRFGEKEPAPVQKAAPPPPVAVVAAPVRIIIVPVLIKTRQYCSVLDIEFDIKQDSIQPEEKEKLAVLGTFMTKYPDTTAVIEGHSDDIGTSEFNMKLSQQRAQSVVDYLENELHIAPSRLSAVGYGEVDPIADNSTSEGKQANRRINAVVACATDIAGLKVVAPRITMALEMEFDPYKSNIEPQYLDGLREVATFMKANPTVTATVQGHADKYLGVGADKIKVNPGLAMEIAQARAQNVVNYLVDEQGIARSRLSTASYGQMRRVAYSTTLEGQQENRRINIIFNYAK